MRKKIRFCKRLILETIEFMYFASAYMHEMGIRNHISPSIQFRATIRKSEKGRGKKRFNH